MHIHALLAIHLYNAAIHAAISITTAYMLLVAITPRYKDITNITSIQGNSA